jgi:hypothetical protein
LENSLLYPEHLRNGSKMFDFFHLTGSFLHVS